MANGQTEMVINERTGAALLTTLKRAEGRWGNFKGLMLRGSMPDSEGLLFAPARGIQTHFMRFPIDLIFLDGENRVIQIREAMAPWKLDFTNAAAVIEGNGGMTRRARLQVGDRLIFQPAAE
ncbi:MAG: DUF192 domain-containing protein [Thermomicrobiales bacterium]